MYGQDLDEGVYYYVLYINYDHAADPTLGELYDAGAHPFVTTDLSVDGVIKFIGNVTIFRKE